MKKFILALMALPLMALGFTSCDDDNDLPEAYVDVTISGGYQSPDDGKIYIAAGDTLFFDALTAVPTNGKKTTLGFTTYYLQGIPFAQTYTAPFAAYLDTRALDPGTYVVQIKSELYQIDKSPAFVLLSYQVEVTEPEDADDTPAPQSSGGYSATPIHTEIAAQ